VAKNPSAADFAVKAASALPVAKPTPAITAIGANALSRLIFIFLIIR
jgi:hypothetical protein